MLEYVNFVTDILIYSSTIFGNFSKAFIVDTTTMGAADDLRQPAIQWLIDKIDKLKLHYQKYCVVWRWTLPAVLANCL